MTAVVSEPLYDNSGIPYGRNTQQLSEYRDRTEQVFGNESETSRKNLKNRKEVRNMSDMIDVTELSRIVLDFENRKYMINEMDIGLYSEVKIAFKNGRWTVQLKSKARFDRSGKAAR